MKNSFEPDNNKYFVEEINKKIDKSKLYCYEYLSQELRNKKKIEWI